MGDDITIGVTEIVNNIEVTAQPNDQIVDISVTDNADNVTLNITPTVVEVNINKGSSFAQWGDLYGTLSDQTDLQNALNLKANLVGGKVPASELPSYVDDIIEVANYAALPATGEIGKIYVTLDNNKIYRWSGSVYIEIASNSAIWGAITGTLSSQTDLVNALNLRVPYTGATSNVNLGEYGLTSGFLGLDTTPTSTPTGIGTIYWDAANRTAALIDGDGDTTLQIGQEQRILVHNNTGSTLTDGQVVYVTGSTGNLPSVSLANASSETTSAATLGVVTESIANGADGFITTSGIVNGLNTLAFNEGDLLWLGTTAGTFTTTKPISPNHLVLIGYVIKKAGGNGSILVKIQNTQELEESSDVLFTSLTNKDFLVYESATDLWKNKSLGTVLGGTSSQFVKGNGTLDSTTYQPLLTNPVTGTGLQNFVTKWTGIGSAITESKIYDNGTNVGIGSINPSSLLELEKNNATGGGFLNIINTNSAMTGKIADINFKIGDSFGIPVDAAYIQAIPANANVSTGASLSFFTRKGNADPTASFTINNVGAVTINNLAGTGSRMVIANSTGQLSTQAITLGTVTSVSALTIGTTGTDITSTVANETTTPVITLNVPTASAANRGALSAADWTTFNSKQSALSGTGFVKISGSTISYDNSTYVPTSRTLTINGTAYDLSADRSWTISAGVTGTGTTNYIPKFTGASAIGNSLIYDNGTNVGIGTTSPAAKLSISYSSATADALNIVNTNTNGRSWYVGDGAGLGAGNFGFYDATAGASRLVISSGGNVGIGTTSPSTLFHIYKASFPILTIQSSSYQSSLGIDTTSGNLVLNNESNAPLSFNTNATERMRITSGGNVEIKNSDSRLLGGNTSGRFIVSNSDTSAYVSINGSANATPNNIALITNSQITFNTGASYSESMRIASSGNLGLSVVPQTWFSSRKAIEIFNGGAFVGVNAGWIESWGNSYLDSSATSRYLQDGIAGLYQIGKLSTGAHVWNTAAAGTAGNPISFIQAMTLTSGGNLLIGTTTDAGYKLDVNGSVRASLFTATSSSNAAIINSTGTSGYGLVAQGTSGGARDIFLAGQIGYSNGFTVQYTGSAMFYQFNGGNVNIPNGTITASGGFFNSDIRLKDLIDYDYNVSDIKPITYLWKDGRDNKKHVGYSAQEVQKVMPDAVNEDEKGFLSVNYVEVLVAKMEAMEKEIAYLKSKI